MKEEKPLYPDLYKRTVSGPLPPKTYSRSASSAEDIDVLEQVSSSPDSSSDFVLIDAPTSSAKASSSLVSGHGGSTASMSESESTPVRVSRRILEVFFF